MLPVASSVVFASPSEVLHRELYPPSASFSQASSPIALLPPLTLTHTPTRRTPIQAAPPSRICAYPHSAKPPTTRRLPNGTRPPPQARAEVGRSPLGAAAGSSQLLITSSLTSGESPAEKTASAPADPRTHLPPDEMLESAARVPSDCYMYFQWDSKSPGNGTP